MNTKTMRLPPRRFLTPSKRKERDGFNSVKPSITTTTTPSKLLKPTTAGSKKHPEPASSNQLLAGCLANEFLEKGTLFGQLFDPAAAARAENMSTAALTVSNQGSEEEEDGQRAESEPSQEAELRKKCERYAEVSGLLKTDGTHIPGIVNPTQLARFLQI